MFDLSNLFHRDQPSSLPKEEIAEWLKVSPERLEAFENAYQIYGMDADTGNLFDQPATEAKDQNAHLTEARDVLENMIDRIVVELAAKTLVMEFKGGTTRTVHGICESKKPVELEEILTLPKELRPQLTGRYIQKDLPGDSSSSLLYFYQKYLEEKNPVKKQMLYHQFRQGLDILDIDPLLYEMLGMNRNSMENWLPQLYEGVKKHTFFKIPDTTIIRVPPTLLQLSRLDYEKMTPTTLEIVDRYCQMVFGLDETKEYFVKTGIFSSKFDFRNAYVHGEQEVQELGEYLLFIQNQSCILAGPLTMPHSYYGVNTTNTWVVRDYIQDKEKSPCIYKGMHLHTEYRVFVDFDTKEVLGINPYWDPDTMKQRFGHEEDADSIHNIHDYTIYVMHEDVLMRRYEDNKETVLKQVEELLPDVPLSGQWSIDVMQNGEDFYNIDMALAENSAFFDCVPKGKRKKAPENWIPVLPEVKR